mmetsp:Transcript_47636/g.110356  ORF Transcript_47636/g.110356 Transcript_47636/m.110356 type:complete len:313 (-) Transcript_47636:65-1003(-)
MGALIGKLLGWVPIRPDTASPSGRDHLSCVIGPLDLYASYDQIWHALVDSFRKDQIVRVDTDTVVKVSVPLPGTWVGSPEKDVVFILEEYHLDKASGKIYGSVYKDVADFDHLAFYRTWQVHRRPLLVEVWANFPGPKHLSAEMRAMYNDNLSIIWRRLDLMTAGRPPLARTSKSLSNPGELCIVIDNLSSYLTFDRLWDEWIDIVKYPEGSSSDDVETQTDNEFTVYTKTPLGPNGEVLSNTLDFRVNKAKGEIITSMGSPPVMTSWTKIHKDPLLIETWAQSWVIVSDGVPVEVAAGRFWECLRESLIRY